MKSRELKTVVWGLMLNRMLDGVRGEWQELDAIEERLTDVERGRLEEQLVYVKDRIVKMATGYGKLIAELDARTPRWIENANADGRRSSDNGRVVPTEAAK